MVKEKDIGGIEIQFLIRFNPNDKRKYFDKYLNLHDIVADAIKDSGHILIATIGRPILKMENKVWTNI